VNNLSRKHKGGGELNQQPCKFNALTITRLGHIIVTPVLNSSFPGKLALKNSNWILSIRSETIPLGNHSRGFLWAGYPCCHPNINVRSNNRLVSHHILALSTTTTSKRSKHTSRLPNLLLRSVADSTFHQRKAVNGKCLRTWFSTDEMLFLPLN